MAAYGRVVTADEVLSHEFDVTSFRPGYDQRDVDTLLDEVIATLRGLANTRLAEFVSGGGDRTQALAEWRKQGLIEWDTARDVPAMADPPQPDKATGEPFYGRRGPAPIDPSDIVVPSAESVEAMRKPITEGAVS